GLNVTHQHLDQLNRIALRHKIIHHDAEKNYAIGNIELEDSDPEDKHNSESESESTENDEISDIINIYSY
ncbi:3685_t:CDS:1, partial [Funneliformis mosseae]